MQITATMYAFLTKLRAVNVDGSMILQGILPSTSFSGVAVAVGQCVENPYGQFVAIQSNAWIQKNGGTASPCWNSINITTTLAYQSPPSFSSIED